MICLTTLCIATEAPIMLAPAMNRVMWANKATQANVETLVARGVRILGPGVRQSGLRGNRRGAHVGACCNWRKPCSSRPSMRACSPVSMF